MTNFWFFLNATLYMCEEWRIHVCIIAVRECVLSWMRVHYIVTDRSQVRRCRWMDCHRLTFCGDEMQSVSKILRSSSASCASRVSASSDAIPLPSSSLLTSRKRDLNANATFLNTYNRETDLPGDEQKPAAMPTKRLRDLNANGVATRAIETHRSEKTTALFARASLKVKEPSEALLFR